MLEIKIEISKKINELKLKLCKVKYKLTHLCFSESEFDHVGALLDH